MNFFSRFKVLLFLCLIVFLSSIVWAIIANMQEKFETSDNAIGQNSYHYRNPNVESQDTLVVLVHGYTRTGNDYYGVKENGDPKSPTNVDGSVDYAYELTEAGYDVVVVDKRSSVNENYGDPGINFGFEDQAKDIMAAINKAKEHFSDDNIFGDQTRDYDKVTGIGHSEGALDWTVYTNSEYYQGDVEELFMINPVASGTTQFAAEVVGDLLGDLINIPATVMQNFPGGTLTGSLLNNSYLLQFGLDQLYSLDPYAHADSLQKMEQMMSGSDFMQNIGSQGPLAEIPTHVVVGTMDWIVGMQQLYPGRDDIMYEVLNIVAGLGHGGLDGRGPFDAILDKMKNGDKSNKFRNTYDEIVKSHMASPYFNTFDKWHKEYGFMFLPSWFNAGMQIVRDYLNPDESFDVSTYVVLPQQSMKQVQDLYARIAYEKGYSKFAEHYEYVNEIMQAQAEFDELVEEDSVDELLEKWQNKLSDKAKVIKRNYYEALEEIYNIPDVAALAAGFAHELMSIIQVDSQEPVRMVKPEFPPSLVDKQPVLILPSGALSGLNNSVVFKEVLKQYVSAGGTIISFAQKYGYEFAALPNGPSGYGWVEDQACHGDAVYVDMEHPALAGQEIKDIDAAVDGYFTRIPDNVKVLLRRTKNQYPTLIEYPYGKGRVIATTMYEDWAYGHGQSTSQARKLIRDLVSWAKATSPMLENPVAFNEYNRGDTVNVDISLEAASFLEENAAKATLYYTDANRNVISEEIVELAADLEPGQQVMYNHNLNLADDAPLGVCYIDYDLLNASDEVIQPRAEGTAFAVKLAELGGGVRLPDVQMWVTSYDEAVQSGTPVNLEIHIRNNTQQVLDLNATVGHMNVVGNFLVQPNSTKVFNYDYTPVTLPQFQLFEVINTANDKIVASTRRFFTGARYAIQPNVNIEKTEYEKGDTVNVDVSVLNQVIKGTSTEATKDLLVKNIVTDAEGTVIFIDEQTICFSTSTTEEKTLQSSFILADDISYGRCVVRTEVYDNSNKVGISAKTFDINSILLNIAPNYPEAYVFGDNVLSFDLENVSSKTADSLDVEITVTDEQGQLLYSKNQTMPFAAHESKTVSFDDLSFGNLKFGDYTITTKFKVNELYYKFVKEIKSELTTNFIFDKTKYFPFDNIAANINVKNTGDFAYSSLNAKINNAAINVSQAETLSLTPNQEQVYTVNSSLPEAILAGMHSLELVVVDESLYKVKQDFVVPDSKLEITKITDSSQATNMIEFELSNVGGGATDYLLEFTIKDLYGNTVHEHNVESNLIAQKTENISVNLSSQILSGDYSVGLTVNDKTTQKVFYKKFTQTLAGIDVTMSLNLDQEIYSSNDDINMDLSIDNKDIKIDNAKLNLEIIPESPFGTLYGTVADESSNPIAGAEVIVAGQTVYTNNLGVYKFDFLPVGEYDLVVKKQASHKSVKKIIIAKGLIEDSTVLSQTLYSTVEGTISDTNGNPITNALVKLSPVDVPDSYPVQRALYVNTQGKYSFVDIPYGQYQIQISSPMFNTLIKAVVVQEATQIIDENLDVHVYNCSYEGRLLTAFINKPVVGARISIGEFTAVSDDQGRFQLNDVPSNLLNENNYQLKLDKENELDKFIYVPFNEGNNDLGDIDITVNQAVDIVGQIKDSATEQPVPNATLKFTPITAPASEFSVYANSQGEYQFYQVPVGLYDVVVSRNYYQDYLAQIVITSSNSEYNFKLDSEIRQSKVLGTVIDGETLQPLENVKVSINSLELHTDLKGYFEFTSVPFSSINEISILFELENYDSFTAYRNLNDGDLDLGQIILNPSSPNVESGTNSDFDKADYLSLNSDISGYIDVIGAQDLYQIDLPQPGNITVGITNGTGGVFTQVVVFDYNKEHIVSSPAYSGRDGFYQELKLEQLEAGKYYLRVQDRFNSKINIEPYKINASYAEMHDLYEPNQSIDQASDLQLHETITGAIFPKADADYYRLNLEGQGQVTATLTDVPAGIYVGIFIVDEQGNLIAAKTDNNNVGRDEFVLNADIENSGTYFCAVYDRDNSRISNGSYKLKVTFETIADSNINNNDFNSALALKLDQAVYGAIFPKQDIDYYKFSLAEDKSVEITVTNVPDKVYAALTLYDSQNRVIGYKKDYIAGRDSFTLPGQYLAAGDYYITFADRDNSISGYSSDSYSLIVNDLSAIDAYENNNSLDKAYLLEQGHKGKAKIYPVGDIDYYKFEVSNSAYVKFSLTNIPSNIAKHLQVLDSAGNVLKDRKYNYGGGSYSIDASLTTAGEYYIMFADAGVNAVNNSSLDEYDFELTVKENTVSDFNDSFDTAVSLYGEMIYPTIYPAGDRDFYKINVPTAGKLNTYIDVKGALGNLEVNLYDQEFNLLANKYYMYSSARSYNFDLDSAGIYYLEFGAKNTNEASLNPYKFKLSFTSSEEFTNDEVKLYAETINPINIEQLQTYNLAKQIDSIGLVGNYQLKAELLNVKEQGIVSELREFSLQDADVTVNARTNNKVVAVGESIEVSGTFNLGMQAASGERMVQLLNGAVVLDSKSYSAQAGDSVAYSLSTVMQYNTEILGIRILPDDITTTVKVEKSNPDLELKLIGPEKVSRKEFETFVELKNTGNVEIDETICLSETCQNALVPVGQTKTVAFVNSVSNSTQYTYEITGTVEEQLTHSVELAENVKSDIANKAVYAEGLVYVPFTLENTGDFDSELDIEISVNDTIINRSYFIPKAEQISDTISVELSEGNYQLEYTSPFEKITKDITVAKFNQIELAANFSEIIDSKLPVTIDLKNDGYNDVNAKIQVQTSFALVEEEVSITNGSEAFKTLELNTSAATGGDHDVKVKLLGEDGMVIAESEYLIEIFPAEFNVSNIDIPDSLVAGDMVELKFVTQNIGGLADNLAFELNLYDLYKEERLLWLEPGQTQDLVFNFPLDENLEDKVYHGEYSLNGVKHYFDLDVEGIKITVDASLDKAVYRESENAMLTINVNNENSKLINQAFFLKVHYGDFEYEEDFILDNSKTIDVSIPVVKDASKVFYAIYAADGRSIYLNTKYIYNESELVTLYTDKDIYEEGEQIVISGLTETAGQLVLSYFSDSNEIEVDGAFTHVINIPSTLQSGTYNINYNFKAADGTVLAGSHKIDIHGFTIKIWEKELESNSYSPGDTLNARIVVESNRVMNTIIKTWLVSPSGEFAQLDVLPVTLDKSNRNEFNLEAYINSFDAGIHKYVFALYGDNDELLASTFSTFDLGGAVLIDAQSVIDDYAAGDEDVVVKLSVMGNKDAKITVFENEQVIHSEDSAVNGYQELDVILRPNNKGLVELLIEVDCEGILSRKEISFKYGHVSPVSSLVVDVEKNMAKLSWQKSPDTDVAGYKLKLGQNSGEYSQEIDLDNVDNYNLEGLAANVGYYAAVIAYDEFGNESHLSNEVSIIVEEIINEDIVVDDAIDSFTIKWMQKNKKKQKKHSKHKYNYFTATAFLEMPEGIKFSDLEKDFAVELKLADFANAESVLLSKTWNSLSYFGNPWKNGDFTVDNVIVSKALIGRWTSKHKNKLRIVVNGRVSYDQLNIDSNPKKAQITLKMQLEDERNLIVEQEVNCKKKGRFWTYLKDLF